MDFRTLETFHDPLAAFLAAWRQVHDTAPAGFDPATTTLATTDPGGQPSARQVLVRGADTEGFSFFTNYGSRKSLELDATGRGALCFFWFWLELQVRVEGLVRRTTDAESDAYFGTRPRGSQLGAWASRQSEPLASRDELVARYREFEARFEGRPVPRPPFWGGYRLVPDRVEFWKAGEFRLHDRLAFTREGDRWSRTGLYP